MGMSDCMIASKDKLTVFKKNIWTIGTGSFWATLFKIFFKRCIFLATEANMHSVAFLICTFYHILAHCVLTWFMWFKFSFIAEHMNRAPSFVPLRSFLCKPLISQRILNGFNMPWLEEAGKISKLILSNFQPFMIWSIIKGMNELMKETLKINFGILLLFIKSQHVKGRLTYEQC